MSNSLFLYPQGFMTQNGGSSTSGVHEENGTIKFSTKTDDIFINDNGQVFFSKENSNATIELLDGNIFVRKV